MIKEAMLPRPEIGHIHSITGHIHGGIAIVLSPCSRRGFRAMEPPEAESEHDQGGDAPKTRDRPHPQYHRPHPRWHRDSALPVLAPRLPRDGATRGRKRA